MKKRITLPDGTTTARVNRFDYKFCVALKIGNGAWFSSWAITEAAANRTVEIWQKSCKSLEYSIITL